MENKRVIVLLVTVFCLTHGEDSYFPPYITPCQIDKEFESCVRKQIEISLPKFTKGIPELGVPSIDPVNLEDIKIDGSGLKLLFTEAQLHGLSKSQPTHLTISSSDGNFELSFKSNISVTAKYTIDGKILILPIMGKGDATVKAHNIETLIKGKLIHHNDSKGMDHIKLVTPSYNYTIEKTTFQFENLFNGNKELSETTHKFANENWQQIMDEVAPPAVKQIVKNTVKVINKFFAKVTTKQIVPSYKQGDTFL